MWQARWPAVAFTGLLAVGIVRADSGQAGARTRDATPGGRSDREADRAWVGRFGMTRRQAKRVRLFQRELARLDAAEKAEAAAAAAKQEPAADR